MNLSAHPIQLAMQFAQQLPDNAQYTFDIYEYIPQSFIDNRSSFTVSARDIDEKWLIQQLNVLPTNKEICWSSKVIINDNILHIPMIDFATENKQDVYVVENLMNVKPSYYLSGRSFHAYFPTLLNDEQWAKFMGTLLLCNPPDREIIDNRWVGHRLMGQFSSLRWSCNTKQYKQLPQFSGKENNLIKRPKI